MDPLLAQYLEYRRHIENPIAAAIVVLADVIQEKTLFDPQCAENFGHELYTSLKEVMSDATMNVSVASQE